MTRIRSKDILKKRLILAIVLVLILAAVAFYFKLNAHKAADPYYPKATESAKTSTPHASASPTPTVSVIPKTSSAQQSSSGDVVVSSPTQGSTVTSGTKVTGKVNIPQKTLYFRLKGGKSGQLASGSIQVTPNTDYSYSFELSFANQVAGGSDQGVLEIYTLSSNGSVNDIANVTVNIQG